MLQIIKWTQKEHYKVEKRIGNKRKDDIVKIYSSMLDNLKRSCKKITILDENGLEICNYETAQQDRELYKVWMGKLETGIEWFKTGKSMDISNTGKLNEMDLHDHMDHINEKLVESDSAIEISRGINHTNKTNQIWPNFNPLQRTPIVWHNGKAVEKMSSLESNMENINNHQQSKPTNYFKSSHKIMYTIMAINIPHFHTKNRSKNILQDMTDMFMEYDIFCISEWYWKPEFMHCTCPNGYKMVVHPKGIIKSSAIIYKMEFDKHIKDVSFGIMTGIEVCTTGRKKTNIYAIYHTQSYVYGELFIGYGFSGINAPIDYSRDVLNKIKTVLRKKCTVVVGDVNWDLNPTFRKKTRKFEQIACDEIGKLDCTNHWANLPSFPTAKGESSLDICISSKETELANFEINTGTYGIISDHYAGTFTLPFGHVRLESRMVQIREKTFQFKTKERFKRDQNLYGENAEHETSKYRNFIDNIEPIHWTAWGERMDKAETANMTPKDIQTIYDGMLNLSNDVNPTKWIKLNVEKMKVTRTADFYNMKKKQKERIISLRSLGLCIKSDVMLKNMNKNIKYESIKMKRAMWKNVISERIRERKMNWSFVHEFHKQNISIPDNLREDDFAKHFTKMMYDYTPCSEWWEPDLNRFPTKFQFQLPIVAESDNKAVSMDFYINGNKGSKHSAGLDGMTLAFLQLIPKKYYNLLAKFYTKLLENGLYMEEYRNIKCTVIHKKNERDLVKNYRPIQIAPTMGNIQEGMVSYQSQIFAVKEKTLSDDSYGFLTGKDPGMLMAKLGRFHTMAMSVVRMYHAIIVTDFSNAFGSPDEIAIMKKFQEYYTECPLKSLRSFLTQPSVNVVLNGNKSATYDASKRGFSQGSKLSPYAYVQLFATCHEDMPVGSKMLSFADDATILNKNANFLELEKSTQDSLDVLVSYCKNFNIKINLDKTYVMLMGKKPKKEMLENWNVKIGNTVLDVKNDLEVLGFSLSGFLNRNGYVQNLTNQFTNYNNLILQFRKYTDKKMIATMINSYHHGKFNYMSGYQQLYTPKQYSMMQVKINKLLRIVTLKKQQFQNMVDNNIQIGQYKLLEDMNLKSIPNLHRRSQMVALGKLVWQCFPINEFDEFMKLVRIPTRNKRMVSQFFKPELVRNGIKLDRKFNDYAPSCWHFEYGKLDGNIRNNLGSKIFIHNVKKLYKSRCQHSELVQKMCLKCGQNTRAYADPNMVNILRANWEKKNVRQLNKNMERFHTLQNHLQTQTGQNYIEMFSIPVNEIEIFEGEENDFIKRITKSQ